MQLESALVVLEKENTQRGEALQQLRDDAVSLRKKLEELLQIEAALMDKNRSTQQ
jgi:predicted nuclease with TOPRIM domain